MFNLTDEMAAFSRAQQAGDTEAQARIQSRISQHRQQQSAAPQPTGYQKTRSSLQFPDFAKLRRDVFERITADYRQLHQSHRVAKAELEQASQRAYHLQRENQQLRGRLDEMAADEQFMEQEIDRLNAKLAELGHEVEG